MFYIIEKQEQLTRLGPFKDCFVNFIPKNNNFHPALTDLSLIYITDDKRLFMFKTNRCLDVCFLFFFASFPPVCACGTF